MFGGQGIASAVCSCTFRKHHLLSKPVSPCGRDRDQPRSVGTSGPAQLRMGGGHGLWGAHGGGVRCRSVYAGPVVAADFGLPFVSVCPGVCISVGGPPSSSPAPALGPWGRVVEEGEPLESRDPAPRMPLSLPGDALAS